MSVVFMRLGQWVFMLTFCNVHSIYIFNKLSSLVEIKPFCSAQTTYKYFEHSSLSLRAISVRRRKHHVWQPDVLSVSRADRVREISAVLASDQGIFSTRPKSPSEDPGRH